jgi:chromosome partitioning protein
MGATEVQERPVGGADVPRRLKRTIRVLSAGAKGGPGKSFLVKNLSGAAAAEGYNVAVVDFDRQRTVTKWLGRRERVYADGPRILGYEADPADPSDASAVVQMTNHDFVFIDTPPSVDQHSEVLKTLAYGADLVLVPSKVGISDTESAEVLLASLAEWSVPTMAILNLVKPSAKRVLKTAQKRLVRVAELCAVEIGDYTDYLTADEGGIGATEMRKCGGADNIEAVWAAVCRRLGVGRRT